MGMWMDGLLRNFFTRGGRELWSVFFCQAVDWMIYWRERSLATAPTEAQELLPAQSSLGKLVLEMNTSLRGDHFSLFIKAWPLHSCISRIKIAAAVWQRKSTPISTPDLLKASQILSKFSLNFLAAGVTASSMHAHPPWRLPRDLSFSLRQSYLQGGSSVVSKSEEMVQSQWWVEAVFSMSFLLHWITTSLWTYFGFGFYVSWGALANWRGRFVL